MTTLTTVLQTVAQNPMILSDPTMKKIFSKILEATGEISPIEIQNMPQQQIQQTLNPQPQQGGSVGRQAQPVQ
jgi:hypothetical protein